MIRHVINSVSSVLILACFTGSVLADTDALTAESFDCVRDMTPVRGFYVDNVDGDLAATVAVAQSPTGGVLSTGLCCPIGAD